MKDEMYKKVFINGESDLPKAGLYFCGITDSCQSSFHFNPDDKDDIDFWLGNVMWYLVPSSDNVKSAEEILDSKICTLEYGHYTYSTVIEAMEEYAQSHQVEMPGKEEREVINFILDFPYQDDFVCRNVQQLMSFGEANDNSCELAGYWDKQYKIFLDYVKSQIKQ